jgi:hypothetical protein
MRIQLCCVAAFAEDRCKSPSVTFAACTLLNAPIALDSGATKRGRRRSTTDTLFGHQAVQSHGAAVVRIAQIDIRAAQRDCRICDR